MTEFSYELGSLIFDKIKNKFYFKFGFNDGKFVNVPLDRLAPNYISPIKDCSNRFCDYTIKEFILEKHTIEVGDIVKLDSEKINTKYNSVLVDGIVYTKTTQCEFDKFYHKFYPNSDNGKVYGLLKDLKNKIRQTNL